MAAPIHITSLNDKDSFLPDGSPGWDDHPGEEDGLRGGFNDQGNAPEGEIWQFAASYLSTLGL